MFFVFHTTHSISNLIQSHGFKYCLNAIYAQSLSHVWLFLTPWAVAHQGTLSMEFSRQEYWSGLWFASPGDLLHPWIEPRSSALWADSLPTEPSGKLPSKCSVQSLNRVRLFATPWTVAHQDFLSMEFSRQEYWSGGSHSLCLLPRDLLGPRIEPMSPALAGGFITTEPPGKPQVTKLAISLPAKSLQSHPTLCSPKDCNPPGSSVHGIFQAGILEWVATSYFRESSRPGDQTCFECEFFTTAPPGKLLPLN